MDYQLLLSQLFQGYAHHGWSRQRTLYESLRAAILSGTLAPAMQLPGSRQLAADLSMARNSVIYAYEQLATEGLIIADRRGAARWWRR